MLQQTDKQNYIKPLISVITATFNAAAVLPPTIQSVINQSYKNIEFIIVDGNSTDGTVNVLQAYDNNISHWLSEPDSGVYDAMNKAISLAHGDWLIFLGAGDILNNIIDGIIPKLIDNNTIYYGNAYRKDLNGIYDGKFTSLKLAVKNICHQTIFYPASVFQKYQYDKKYKVFADHVLNIKLFGDSKFKFVHLPITIADYEGGGFSDVTIDQAFIEDRLKIIKLNLPLPVYIYSRIRSGIAKLVK